MKIPALLTTLFCCAAFSVAQADVVELDSGGRVRGEIVGDESSDRKKVFIRLAGGGRLVLNRTGVQKTVEQPSIRVTYLGRAASTADTAESQKSLAMWCRDNKLLPEFRQHMQRVVELDPEDEEARGLLGFRQHRGQWMTREEVMASRGLVRYEGDYRTRQEIELMQRNKRAKQANADWRQRLARWKRDLTSSDARESQAALEAFQNLTDPGAASALVRLLRRERRPAVLSLLIESTARIEHPTTVEALATFSLKHKDYEVRRRCLEHLIKAERPGLSEIYVRSLSSNDNTIVNRAGNALGVISDEDTTSPLIEALVTNHKFTLGKDTPEQTYGMSSNGGFQFGGGKAKVIERNIKNPEVLSALVQLSGENFGFDKQAWNRWLAARAVNETVDLRRDR